VIEFYKYQGAGNDFVIIDDRKAEFDEKNIELINHLCDRHFGIGADGLMLLQNHDQYDFKMVYFNADGNESSMCGNGGRCIVAFAHFKNIIESTCTFLAIDGGHKAEFISNELVSLEMIDVIRIEKLGPSACLLDTGSPHYVELRTGIESMDLISEARAIRYNARFAEKGVNVNFVEIIGGVLHIRTYERGVEDETLACGTGVTAAAIAMNHWGVMGNTIKVKAIGGYLEVSFDYSGENYSNIWKKGPVKQVFHGKILMNANRQ